jgi:hypothetical protein
MRAMTGDAQSAEKIREQPSGRDAGAHRPQDVEVEVRGQGGPSGHTAEAGVQTKDTGGSRVKVNVKVREDDHSARDVYKGDLQLLHQLQVRDRAKMSTSPTSPQES